MDKPYNTEIIKLMAAHSDKGAAYASAMKWDWLRRQKVEDITRDDIRQDCGFCKRWNPEYKKDACVECLLCQKAGNNNCTNNHFFHNALKAYMEKDQQAFTTNANSLYFMIRSIIDDLYKPKEEVFYRVGQKFHHGTQIYRLCMVGSYQVSLIRKGGTASWSSPIKVGSVNKITMAEFNKLRCFGTFTLIEDEKK